MVSKNPESILPNKEKEGVTYESLPLKACFVLEDQVDPAKPEIFQKDAPKVYHKVLITNDNGRVIYSRGGHDVLDKAVLSGKKKVIPIETPINYQASEASSEFLKNKEEEISGGHIW